MNTPRPTIPLKVASGKPSKEALAQLDKHWRVQYLMLAPHRLSFFLAMVVLVASALWWGAVQVDRATGWLGLPYASGYAVLSHAGAFGGDGARLHSAVLSLASCSPQAPSGWGWIRCPCLPCGPRCFCKPLVGCCGSPVRICTPLWPWAGLALACAGLAWMTVQFWGRVRLSQAEDQLHARVIGFACVLGTLSAAGVWVAMLLQAHALARVWVFCGLWGFVVVVYVTVAHRMIPFFTSSAMPLVQAWRPFWVLWLMLAAAGMQVLAAWLEWGGIAASPAGPAWAVVHGTLQVLVGGVLVWLAWVWGLVQSLKNKLLAMLHIGFLWLGVAFLLGGLAQWLAVGTLGVGSLGLGALHALSMGCLASLMLAMVTRVSCGHGGRALVADRIVWSLFCLLQAGHLAAHCSHLASVAGRARCLGCCWPAPACGSSPWGCGAGGWRAGMAACAPMGAPADPWTKGLPHVCHPLALGSRARRRPPQHRGTQTCHDRTHAQCR
jgi:uncharacterized protein involved in response to NO